MSWRRAGVVMAVVAVLAMATLAIAGTTPAADKRPEVMYPLKSDVLPSLRDVPIPAARPFSPYEVPNRPDVRSSVPGESANVQTAPGAPNTPDPLGGWAGLNSDDNNALAGGRIEPPDTQGDIGADYYIQWINLLFAVYDKTGTKVYPTGTTRAVPGNILWAGFGGPCQNDNDGDPITLWDPLAQRWVMSQFAVNTNYGSGPYYQCVAVSATSDPTGAWNRYAFQWPGNRFPDYPKLGVWSDGYYITTNDFNAGLTSFVGVTAGVFDRTAMLAGSPTAAFVSFQLDPNIDYSMLPADLDGLNAPPAGAPGLFAEFQDSTWTGETNDQIWIYEFDVDWVNPANSTFGVGATHTPNYQLDITNVSDQCSSRNCVPQPGAEGVDAIDFRTMYRLAYRNNTVGGEMMVTSMTVAGGGKTGVWWGEFHKSGGWTLHQDGVYSPADTTWRFMPSVAQDTNGNIMLGYSASSTSIYPSVWYVGRLATDPLGTMGDEKVLATGTASKTSGYYRWGDYSMMSVDPVDDCTFWYTQEYITTGGNFQFQTYIGSMKFPSCSTGPTGTVTGTVTSTAGGAPIAGAQVQVGSYSTTTNGSGVYTITVPTGTYDITASKFGFGPETVTGVVVNEGATVTQDFALTPVGTYWVDGFVTAADHEWPLWAKIEIEQGGTLVQTLYTSPWNGYYEVELPNGVTYDFTVHSMYTGYLDEMRPVTVASADQTQSFTLLAASGNPAYACTLVGGINEQFEGDFPPAGWTVLNAGSVVNNIWKRNDVWGAVNRTTSVGGSGFSADADSDRAGSGSGPFDTTLVSPFVLMPATPRQLVFASNFQDNAGDGDAWFDIWTSGGGWTNLWFSSVDDPSSGVARTFDLTAYAGQQVQFRWRYVATVGYAWYWQIDNVRTETIPPPPPAALVEESFAGTTFPPTNWTVHNVDGGGSTWARSTTTYHDAAGSAYHNYSSASNQDGWLVTPYFTIPNANQTLTYWHYNGFPSYYVGHYLWVCTAGAGNCDAPPTNFTSLGAIGNPNGAWVLRTNSLAAYNGQTIRLAWQYTGDDADSMYVDQVRIAEPFTPVPPVVDNPTLDCSPVEGSMVAGFVSDENTTLGLVGAGVAQTIPVGPAAETMDATGNLPAGFYYMFSPKAATTAPEGPSTRTFTASMDGYGDVSHQVNLIPDTVNRLDFVLPAANLSLADWPFVIAGRLTPDGQPTWDKTDTFSILNSGGLPADVSLNAQKVSASWPLRWPAFVPEAPRVGEKPSAGRAPVIRLTPGRTTHPELAGALAGVQAFGIDAYPGENLVTWPDGSVPGTWSVIGSVAGTTYFAGDFLNGDYSTLYVLDSDSSTLRTLDTTTGAMTLIGPATPEGGESWSGLKGSSDGNVYASATTCSASSLYTVDPGTGAVTRIGNITNGACVIDIAINADGAIYGVDLVSSSLLSIDPATGAGTVVGPLGVAPNYAQGMDFEEDSGILYWAAYITQGELRTIDTATGASYLIGAFPGGAEVDAFTFASGGGGGGLPWFTVTPTEGTVPADGQLDVLGEFWPEGVDPAHFGLFRASIKSNNDTPADLPDIPVYFTKAFWDVPRLHWADEFIHALAGVRITKGCGGGNFCPDNNITRSDMAILMVRAIHGPDFMPPPAVGIFVDVPISDTDTTANYIEQLYNDGVVAGCAQGGGGELYFCPSDLVSRAQMAVFVCAGLGIPPVDPPTGYFTDVHGTVYQWAEGFIEAIFNEGITAGCDNYMFCPALDITRSQLAVWLTVGLDLPKYRHEELAP